MHRYYMTAKTREALIAKSNRLIAARAVANASRHRPESDSAAGPFESEWPESQGDTEASASDLDSAFARLVQDLQATSALSRPS